MCIYTKYIENPKYKPNKKNGYNPPECPDERLRYVPVSCGKCFECRKKKQREWLCRLSEEIRNDNNAVFATLTLSDKSFYELREDNEDENKVIGKAIRRFLERIRKETKHSIKHWFITELGGEHGRIHIHGIVWADNKTINKHWKYGYIWLGQYVNERTINYITKYMLKDNEVDKSFIGKVFCSAGIGRNYLNRMDSGRNRFREDDETDETYRTRTGSRIYLPQYYRNKIYTDEQKEKLWIEKQEQGYRYIDGEKVSTNDEDEYLRRLEKARAKGRRLYDECPEDWDKEIFKRRLKKINEYKRKEHERMHKESVNNI